MDELGSVLVHQDVGAVPVSQPQDVAHWKKKMCRSWARRRCSGSLFRRNPGALQLGEHYARITLEPNYLIYQTIRSNLGKSKSLYSNFWSICGGGMDSIIIRTSQ